MSDLFISHASEDGKTVGPIVDYLEGRGVSCWISSRDIPPRSIYAEAITAAMRDAGACVVIVSQASNQSDAIKRELELASHYKKPFIPIRIDDTEPGPGLDYYLRNTQWIDYHSERERALERIVSLGSANIPRAAPPAGHTPARKAGARKALPLILGGGALIAAALAGVIVLNGASSKPAATAPTNMVQSATASEAPAPGDAADGLWGITVRCANGSVVGEPSARVVNGHYDRRFPTGQTHINLSLDANQIHVTGNVAFDAGQTYALDAQGTLQNNGYAGTAVYGTSSDCAFTAQRQSD